MLNTISRKFLLPTLALTAVLLGGMGYVLAQHNRAAMADMMAANANAIVSFLAKVSLNHYQNFDYMQLEDLVSEVTKHPEIVFAVFFDAKDSPLTKGSTEPADTRGMIVYDRPITEAGGAQLGRLKLGFSDEALAAGVEKNISLVGGGVAIATVCLFIGVSLLTRLIIVRRVKQTVAMLKDVAEGEGDLTKRLAVKGKDELAELAIWFNRFIDNIEQVVTSAKDGASTLSSLNGTLIVIVEGLNRASGQSAQQTETISATMMQMTANLASVAGTTAHAAKAVQESVTGAAHGKQAAEAAVSGMARVAETVELAATTSAGLGEASIRIGRIVDLISEIADQINLVALNAAIEAARAGETGAGFAVVAGEARQLALKTGQATNEIAAIIKKIQQETQVSIETMDRGKREVDKGVALIDRVSEALEHIVWTSQRCSELVKTIASATEEQATGIAQVTENMSSITSAASAARQEVASVGSAADGLQQVVSSVSEAVGWFKTRASAPI